MNDATQKPAAITPTIGNTYLSGSSMRPVKDTVLGIVCWELLPKHCKETQRTLGPQHGYDPEALIYVLYRASNRKQLGATPVNVFSHTRYITNGDMFCYGLRGKRPAV